MTELEQLRTENAALKLQVNQARDTALLEAEKLCRTIYAAVGQPDDPHPDAIAHNDGVKSCIDAIRSLKPALESKVSNVVPQMHSAQDFIKASRIALVSLAHAAEKHGIYQTDHDRFATAITTFAAQLEKEAARPELTVWYGAMPESNGSSNFTAVLMRKGQTLLDGMSEGFTFARSEYPDRVRYEADCMRFLIGELGQEPDILDYDSNKHSGYTPPSKEAFPTEPSM